MTQTDTTHSKLEAEVRKPSGWEFFPFMWGGSIALGLILGAWIGIRDIWMDYIQPVGLRLTLHVLTATALVGYTAWAAAILWRL